MHNDTKVSPPSAPSIASYPKLFHHSPVAATVRMLPFSN